MTDKHHEAPSYLSDTSKEIFKFYTGKSIKTPGQVALLIRGLESLDCPAPQKLDHWMC